MDVDWIQIGFIIIVAVSYGIRHIFGRNDEEGETGGSPPQNQEISPEVRRLQEEIRRKIEARRQQEQQSEPEPVTPGQSPPRQPVYQPTFQPGKRRVTELPPQPQPRRQSAVKTDMSYELEFKNRQITELELQNSRLMDALRRRRGPHTGAAEGAGTSRMKEIMRSAKLSQAVDVIRVSEGARLAFVYSEILGTPVSQRRHPAHVPPGSA